MKVYFDNAATTQVEPLVIQSMVELLQNDYGNPSSIHAQGRKARALIEGARKSVAQLINAHPSEIVFTSGGTEADNHGLTLAVRDLGVKTIITSAIEHHAILHTCEAMHQYFGVNILHVNLLKNGVVDLNHLEELLRAFPGPTTLVSLMHANNEIGNLLPLAHVSQLCQSFGVYFQSDMVQSFGHFAVDFQQVKVNFSACSAHKFHGPKGVGFFYCNNAVLPKPLIHGGSQERNMRGGTENIAGIVGLAKAFELAHTQMQQHQEGIVGLKNYFRKRLKESIPAVEFNGDSAGEQLYTVLSVLMPPCKGAEMLLFNLDIRGIAVSGGSACSSGSDQGSHVLRNIGVDQSARAAVRFSFSKYNTQDEVDYCVGVLDELVNK